MRVKCGTGTGIWTGIWTRIRTGSGNVIKGEIQEMEKNMQEYKG
jgi:hypothetical protein